MKSKIFFLALCITAIVLASCTSNPVQPVVPTPAPNPTPSPILDQANQTVVDSNTKFAIDMYNRMEKDKNVFFSPYSISVALAMTMEGAKGQTLNEMKQVLHLNQDTSTIRNGFLGIQYTEDNQLFKLYSANALWVQKNYNLLPDFTTSVQRYYLGEDNNLDFIGDTENSRVTINKWVESKTNDKIKDLIPKVPEMITPSTRLVLTNAIYFNGTWVNKFEKEATIKQDFKVNPEKKVQADMMQQQDTFGYAETNDLQALKLDYEGGKISMLVLLPKTDFGSIDLSAENLKSINSKLERQLVNVYLPKFNLTYDMELSQTLKDMGMVQAFSGGADFSGMTTVESLQIGAVIHKAFVDVNEDGTEAAAATAVIMVATAMPVQPHLPPKVYTFRADHPFVFLIQDDTTGSILFMGKIADPTQS